MVSKIVIIHQVQIWFAGKSQACVYTVCYMAWYYPRSCKQFLGHLPPKHTLGVARFDCACCELCKGNKVILLITHKYALTKAISTLCKVSELASTKKEEILGYCLSLQLL